MVIRLHGLHSEPWAFTERGIEPYRTKEQYGLPHHCMQRSLFRLLARLNKAVLPKLWDKDLLRLSKMQKAIVAWRIWVTKNAL